jgi:flagellar biosynthetic protein FliR
MEKGAFILFGGWLLAFVRIIGIFGQAPIWGNQRVPRQVLPAMAAILAIIVFPFLKIPENLPCDTIGFLFLLGLQYLIGRVIGYISFLVLSACQFAGQLLDIQMGLSSAASYDPSMHGPVNLIWRFEFYFAMTLYLVLNFDHEMIRTIFKSFEIIPLNGFSYPESMVYAFRGSDGLMKGLGSLSALTGNIFFLAIKLSAPVLAALFIVQIALGMMARVAPQMNVFMLSFPLNIGIGLIIFIVSLTYISGLLGSNEGLFIQNFNWIDNIMKMMKVKAGG